MAESMHNDGLMSDIQTTQDLHAKFIHLIKHYAKRLVEDKVYSLEAAACQGIIEELEGDFLDEYAAELTEDEMHWFWNNRFDLDLPRATTVQQLIEVLQQHNGNLPIQFYINKVPIANVDVSIDYQPEQFVAFSLVSCCDDDATS